MNLDIFIPMIIERFQEYRPFVSFQYPVYLAETFYDDRINMVVIQTVDYNHNTSYRPLTSFNSYSYSYRYVDDLLDEIIGDFHEPR